jgi:DNA-binding PadR family transcriptional regulator
MIGIVRFDKIRVEERSKVGSRAGCGRPVDCVEVRALLDSAGSGERGGAIGATERLEGAATPKDVFLGEVKSRSVFPLLILHLVRRRPEYGNSIIKGVKEITGGVMGGSPNNIYPLLRRLEEKGYVVGEWERPETRSRRFYRITPEGEEKYAEIKARFEGHLLRVKGAVEALHAEIYGRDG